MAQDIPGTLPNFSSNNEVLPYLFENRNNLTMMQIIHASDWALDPGFIQRNAITQFILRLPRAQQHQLVGNEECLLCNDPYETTSDALHFPIVLPCCELIVGAACLFESLKTSESCVLCRATILTRPAAAAPPLANPASEGILRGLLKSGRDFLEEESISDKSYAAFKSWAHGNGTNSTDVESIIARALAREAIRKFQLSSLTS